MPSIVRFGAYEVDLPAGQLYKYGTRISLRDQSFQVLAALLEHPGQVVTREELRQRLWREEVFVDFDNNLNTAVGRLREALGDSADHPRFIETLPKRGYRFLENVSPLPETDTYLKRVKSDGVSSPEGVMFSLKAAVDVVVPDHVQVQEPMAGSLVIAAPLKRRRKAALAGVAIVAALAGLVWLMLRRPAMPSAELTQKRLTFNSRENPVQRSTISPDGNYLAYSDAAGIHVKLLSTGDERLIPRPAGVPADALWSVDSWFPDGTQMLADISEMGGQESVWTVSVLGQSARELRDGARGYDVSPDGTRIAFGPREPQSGVNPREIWMMDSQGGNPQKVVALALGDNEGVGSVRWSPDGQRLAYTKARRTPAGDYQFATIESCDLKGMEPTVIVSEPDLPLRDFWWLPGGRIVYSRREKSRFSADDNLWQIDIDSRTGTPNGKSKRITEWAGASLGNLSASADGKRLAFLRSTSHSQIYLGELAAGGTRLSSLRRLRSQETDDRPSGWTADSKAVLFDSSSNGAISIFKQRINEDTAQLLVEQPQRPAAPVWPRLSADGNWIIYAEAPKTPSAPLRMMRIPVNGGVPQFVTEAAKGLDDQCARALASLCVALEESQDDKHLMISAFDPLKGTGKVLRTIEKDPGVHFFGSGLSPDGSTFAISRSYEAGIYIRLLSLSGGPDREITVKGWSNLPWAGLNWSADGNGLYAGSVSPQATTLLYVDLKGNARVLWQYRGAGAIWGIPSPDGRYLAIEGRVFNSSAWMLEGF